MEELLKYLLLLLGPGFGGWFGKLLLAVVLVPTMYKAWESWADARSGKHRAKREKRRLEILKLTYEIAALRKVHDLPDLSPKDDSEQLEKVKVPEQPMSQPPQKKDPGAPPFESRDTGLLVWSIIGLIIFWPLAIVSFLVFLLFAIALMMPPHVNIDEELTTTGIAAALMFASFYIIRQSRRNIWNHRIKLEATTP